MITTTVLESLRTRALAWARGRFWYIRLPLVVWLANILRQHLRDRDYVSLFGGLNLGIHELGHFVFAPLGEFMGVAGGSLLQCLAPVVAAWSFWRQEDFFGISVAWFWLGINLFEVARYAGDARAQLLPLVSPVSGDPIHDWNYLLGTLGLLRQDQAIAGLFRASATGCMLIGVVMGAWLLWKMYRPESLSQAEVRG
jgi:hypothetical protein